MNFALGFGPEPRARMLENIEKSACLSTCHGRENCKDYFLDNDRDKHGNPAIIKEFCVEPDEGYVLDNSDCDDNDDKVWKNAKCYDSDGCEGYIVPETCACKITEEPETWYYDADNDGLGDRFITIVTCSPPKDYTDNPFDCDHNDPSFNANYVYAECNYLGY